MSVQNPKANSLTKIQKRSWGKHLLEVTEYIEGQFKWSSLLLI